MSTRSRLRKKGYYFEKGRDIKRIAENLIEKVDFSFLKKDRIFYFRSYNSKSRAYARIWGLPKIFQEALSIEPAYIIEVISESFDKLDRRRKKEVLLHELAHIPKNFSGSLIPHFKKGKGRSFSSKVKRLIKLIR